MPQACVFPAALTAAFLGVDMFKVAVNGVDDPLNVRTRELIVPVAKDEVGTEIDAAEVLVFAAPEA
jgi:hypothetical protein